MEWSGVLMPYPQAYYEMLTQKFWEAQDAGLTHHEALQVVIEKHDLERAVAWNTTCRGCADLLDKLYERDVEDGVI